MLAAKLFAYAGNPVTPNLTPVEFPANFAETFSHDQAFFGASYAPSGATFGILIEARLSPDAPWCAVALLTEGDGAGDGGSIKALDRYPLYRVTHVSSSLSSSPLTALSCWGAI